MSTKSRFGRSAAWFALISIVALPAGSGEAAEFAIGSCPGNYQRCLSDWRSERLRFLRGADGYLNLRGLYWLDEGASTFGSHESNDIVFPDEAPAFIGTFDLTNGAVEMSVLPGIDARADGQQVDRINLRDDSSGQPTEIGHGSLSWTIIRRGSRFAVRLRDFEHPALAAFPPIAHFPAQQRYRVQARFIRYAEPRIVRVDTVIAGLDYNPQSSGVARFELDGEVFELEAYDSGNELFFVFGDATTGRESYPAGRFLYSKRADSEGSLVLDFNTAHNPPCAFNEYATCPVASARNRLKVPVEAGEKYDPAVHH